MDEFIKVLPVAEYNLQAEQRYNKAWETWEPGGGRGEPFIGCYLFFDNKGEEPARGWVATVVGKDYHFYSKTKKGAIQKALLRNKLKKLGAEF